MINVNACPACPGELGFCVDYDPPRATCNLCQTEHLEPIPGGCTDCHSHRTATNIGAGIVQINLHHGPGCRRDRTLDPA